MSSVTQATHDHALPHASLGRGHGGGARAQGRLPRRALRQGLHAGSHAAQPVGRARAGCRGSP
eukprot:3774545-Prymnesium_polylepis.1